MRQRRAGRSGRTWRRSIVAAAVALVALGCSGDADDGGDEGAVDAVGAAEAGIDEVLVDSYADTVPTDRRPELLARLGAPESFVLSVGTVDGVASRFESWQYWSSHTQVDLVDGEIAFNVALAPVPDGTVLPLDYAPDEFVLLSTVEEVHDALVGVELTEIDGVADELGLVGARTFVAEQLLLAFVDDLLVYVQTYPLLTDEAA